MSTDLIKAHLNLYAVLQNLEDLVKLDPDMAALTKNWDVSIQFSVRNGPTAYLEFRDGACRHAMGAHPGPSIKLYFISPKHLNDMFDGKGNPIPLKGFTRLGFLKNEFSKLTDRMEHYLKPKNGQSEDPAYIKINTILTLHTAAHAVKVLAQLDPVCKKVADHIPTGTLQMEVLPEGPYVNIAFGKDTISVAKGVAENPSAKMTFKNLDVAHKLLNGKLDGFLAVAQGNMLLQGIIPIIDNVNLILDRVEGYLK